MEDFNIFSTGGRNKFLGDKKKIKQKKIQSTKQNEGIIKLQKNIRKFIMAMRYGGPVYPLLLTKYTISSNKQLIIKFWSNEDSNKYLVLINRMIKWSLELVRRTSFIQFNIQQFLNTFLTNINQISSLTDDESCTFLNQFKPFFSMQHFSCILQKQDGFLIKYLSRTISKTFISSLEFILQYKNSELTLRFLNIYLNQHEKLEQIRSQLDLEGKSKEFFIEALLFFIQIYQTQRLQSNQQLSENCLCCISGIIKDMKQAFIYQMLSLYKIEVKTYNELTEDTEEVLFEKEEWKEFQSYLTLLMKYVKDFLSKLFTKSNRNKIFYNDIITLLFAFSHETISLYISHQNFVYFLEMMDFRMIKELEEQNVIVTKEILCGLIIIERHVFAMHDLEFIKFFRPIRDHLTYLVKNNLLKLIESIIFLPSSVRLKRDLIKHSSNFLNNIYNKIFRTDFIKVSIFENQRITHKFTNYKYVKNSMEEAAVFQKNFPFILPLYIRFHKFKEFIRQDHYHNYHNNNTNKIKIRRNREFEDAYMQLKTGDIKGRIFVIFITENGMQEQGIDAGGLTKQFLNRVLKNALDPKYGLFIENESKELLPNPNQIKESSALYYEFIGKMIGKVIYENMTLGVKFSGPFLNSLIDRKNSFDDLRKIDEVTYKSLVYILEMEEDVEELLLTFQYKDDRREKLVNLKPKGSSIKVTQENKKEYVDLLWNYIVNSLFATQSKHIRNGLLSVISKEWIFMFNYEELNYLISGSGEINIQDWKTHTRYVGGYNEQDQTIVDFWNIVSAMSEADKSDLLKFVTSCPRPSFLGFKDLHPPFQINQAPNSDSLPSAHTCSNLLDLPDYKNLQTLRFKLYMAIRSHSGFQFG